MDGFINLLKPPGMTSSDAVFKIRKMLPRGVKVGHGGTLDPDAAGVLPISIGRGTRLFDYMIDKKKVYVAEACLGIETDTQDASGKVVARAEVTATEAEIRAAMEMLTGEILQVPPMYSAVKRDGKRMYDLARSGVEVALEPRPARVDAFQYLRPAGPGRFLARIECGRGVYIRTLLHDLGRLLGCGAHMAFLLRTRVGAFDIADAVALDALDGPEAVRGRLVPMEDALDLPVVRVDRARAAMILTGAAIATSVRPAPEDMPDGLVQIKSEDGRLLALGTLIATDSGVVVRPRRVFTPEQ